MVTLVYNIWLHLYYFGPSVFCFVISTPPLSEMYFDVAFLHRTFNGCLFNKTNSFWGNFTKSNSNSVSAKSCSEDISIA